MTSPQAILQDLAETREAAAGLSALCKRTHPETITPIQFAAIQRALCRWLDEDFIRLADNLRMLAETATDGK